MHQLGSQLSEKQTLYILHGDIPSYHTASVTLLPNHYLNHAHFPSRTMLTHIWPLPFVGWLVALATLSSCSAQQKALRYGIIVVWLFYGCGLGDATHRSGISPWISHLEQPIFAPLNRLLGPGPSRSSRIASKYLPTLVLWAQVPLHHGLSHPNVYISAVGFAAILLLQELSGGRQAVLSFSEGPTIQD